MKPSFALNITDTAIGLLHRTARGWLQVGETAFDTADLAEALGYLRGSALGLSPGGLTTKLVLPNSQIKYLELDAPGPTDADRRNQLRAALVGRTPYNVEDLVFDWSGTGPKLQVAVIARETLDEAEAFAVEHRFNPVSFVGLPPKGDFKGEPWFGQTKASASVLEKGEKVDRDAEPVHVTGRDLPKSHPGAAKAAASSSGDVEEAAANPLTENEKPTRAQRRAAATAAAEQSRVSQVEQPAADKPMASDVVTEPTAELTGQTDVPSAVAQSAATNTAPEIQATAPETAPWWASPDPVAEPAARANVPSAAAPPETSVTNNQAFADPVPDNASVATTAAPDDLPPAPSAAMMAAFASRRAGETPSTNRYGGAVADPMSPRASLGGSDLADRLSGKSTPPPLSRPKVGGDASSDVATLRSQIAGDGATASIERAVGKTATGKPSTAFVTAPSIPGSRKRKSLPPGAAAAVVAPDARKSLTKPGGTFASSEKRGKPRYLGLILTGLLLLFLALIAAWSSFFLASNEAAQNGTAVVSAPEAAVPATEIAAAVPAIDDEMLADSQDPADFAGQDASAADAVIDPATDLAAQAPVVGAEPAVETAVEATPTPPPVPEPAPVGIASTDSPNAAPLNEAQDEIFLAAIDAPPLVLDPLSLPQPAASTDALPLPQLEPPPFGTVYQFDADGRIRPTPEGIITPEGVRLVAGKPSLVPPARPDALIAVALPSNAGQGTVLPEAAANGTVAPVIVPLAQTAVPFPSDPALADARPRPRPEGLAPPAAQQANDGASLSEPSATRTSSLRPLPRPTAILAAGEAARQSTAAASLTAQAQQAAAVEAAVQASFQPDPNSSPLAVAVSRKPAPRPKDMSRAVEAAVAAAVRAPEPQIDEAHPEADAEPEIASAAPAIPTRASVAKQATYVNAINLSKINLIGVYGSKSSPYALVRQANGRYKKVKVGDSIDGGKVAAILASELRYQKSGRMISLKLPKT
jgi:hypothetical protein